VVRTFASSAVRLAERARACSIDLTGATVFTGGEPLTDARRDFIESTGARAFPRYVATESGLIAAACRQRKATDDMHVYTDRVALIAGPEELLVTTLSPSTGKVLLNTDLGDTGELTTRRCDCGLGDLGFDLHVAQVRSQHRLTIEGMTVLTADLDAIIGQVIARAGGHPSSYQLRQMHDDNGLNRLVVAISPEVGRLDEAWCLSAIHDGMRRSGGAVALAADVWQQADTFRIVRENPALSPGAKLSSGARVS
jgi:phenylacetate-coenzyme A ligase PaaK-like adenylate-forming protein